VKQISSELPFNTKQQTISFIRLSAAQLLQAMKKTRIMEKVAAPAAVFGQRKSVFWLVQSIKRAW
jgi:hypothetical protein